MYRLALVTHFSGKKHKEHLKRVVTFFKLKSSDSKYESIYSSSLTLGKVPEPLMYQWQLQRHWKQKSYGHYIVSKIVTQIIQEVNLTMHFPKCSLTAI